MAKFFASLLWASLTFGACQTEHNQEEPHVERTPPLDDVTWTTAFLLIGWIVISVGILYLVNCQDKDMRKASWSLINTTFSIFAAATLDFGIVRLLRLVLFSEGHNVSEHHVSEHNIFYHLLVASFPIAVATILHWRLLQANHQEHHYLFAVKTLGGHIYAFAAILVFGDLQKCKPFAHLTSQFASLAWDLWVVLVPFIALLMMILLSLFLSWLTQCVCSGNIAVKKNLQWRQVLDMQIEASTITVGFLLVQAICFWMSAETVHEKKFMPILHGVPGEHRYEWILWVLAVGLLLFSSHWSQSIPNSSRLHSAEFIGELASVTACWCLQRGGLIAWYGLLKGRMEWYLEEMQCKGPVHCEKIVKVKSSATLGKVKSLAKRWKSNRKHQLSWMPWPMALGKR